MKCFIAFLLCVCCASSAYAQRGTKIRFGFLGTTIKAPCGANVCASPCGAKVSYGSGGGYYGGGGCASGYCGGGGPYVDHHSHGGGCGTQCATNACATCPQQQHCHTCPEPYGIRTRSCVDSYLPPPQEAVQLQGVPQYLPQQQLYGAPQGTRVVYIAH